MNQDDLKTLENRFHAYVAPFVAGAQDPEPYRLKQIHTNRVCDNISMLARSLDLSLAQSNIARATALFHDVGRFPQFESYGTFSDLLSKNHAALGVGVMSKHNLLEGVPGQERQLMLRAVTLHNRPRLPPGLEPPLSILARLLRDADKIDIYKVMLELYLGAENGKSSFITHDQKDDGRISGSLADEILSGKGIHYNRVSSLNDMKLFQLSMIYDLNFPAAFAVIRDRQVVQVILDSMPASPKLEVLARVMTDYIDKKINSIAV